MPNGKPRGQIAKKRAADDAHRKHPAMTEAKAASNYPGRSLGRLPRRDPDADCPLPLNARECIFHFGPFPPRARRLRPVRSFPRAGTRPRSGHGLRCPAVQENGRFYAQPLSEPCEEIDCDALVFSALDRQDGTSG